MDAVTCPIYHGVTNPQYVYTEGVRFVLEYLRRYNPVEKWQENVILLGLL